MIFDYKGRKVFFTQTQYGQEVSYKHKSTSDYDKQVFNKWLNQTFHVEKEVKSNDEVRYETTIVINGIYYGLSATLEEDEFIKMVERLTY